MNSVNSGGAQPMSAFIADRDAGGWPAQQQGIIWRSWAQSFARTRNNAAAMFYYNKCINGSDSNQFHALCMRSNFNRIMANAEKSLEDSNRTVAKDPSHPLANLQLADALYDLCRFEDSKIALHCNERLRKGARKLPFQHRLQIVDGNFRDTMGDSLGMFFLKNLSKMNTLHDKIMKPAEATKLSTMWMKLGDRTECDVNSIVEKDNKIYSPLELARRNRHMKIYNQNYLNRSWTDVTFLKRLCQSPIVLLKKYYKSASENQAFLNSSYDSVKKFISMLHARSPMYNEQYRRMANSEMLERMHLANKYRIQYNTRRYMLFILRTIRSIREQKDTQRLRKFVLKVMGEFVVLKTMRVMPWKIEFINEVYNHLALSLCESFKIPNYKVSPYDNDAMCHLLGVNPFKPIEVQKTVFGNRSTYAYDDYGTNIEPGKDYRQMKAKLDRRLHFSTLPIERSYLLYEIADCLLNQNHLVHCLLFAKRSIEEARRANSKIWEFLATMLQAKALAILCKYERQADVLNNAYALAKQLKSPSLCTFIELCRMLNKDYMTLRKMSVLVATKRSRYRNASRSNYTQLQSSPEIDSRRVSG